MELERILAASYAVIGLQAIQIVNSFILFSLLNRMDGRVSLRPKINIMQLTTSALRKIKNMNNAPVVPDIPEWMMERLVVELLRELSRSAPSEIKLSESVWIRDGRWRRMTGGTPQQFRDAMTRLEEARIVTRKDPEKREKSERVFAQPYRSLESKLRKLLPHRDGG